MPARTVIRFTVHDSSTDCISASWTCYVRGNDIYLFCRKIAGALKLSVHARTGQCHLKYEPSFAARNAGVISGPYIEKWTYQIDPQQGWIEPVQIWTPAINVDRAPESKPPMVRIPVSHDHEAVVVRMMVVQPHVGLRGNFFKVVALEAGNRLALAYSYASLPDLAQPAQAAVRPYAGRSTAELHEISDLRALMLAVQGEQRLLFDLKGVASPSDQTSPS